MTIAYGCVLIAAILPYIFTVLAKSGRGFDNRTPREYLGTLQGWRKRAHWVQLNGFEAFAPFAAAVIIAQQMQHVPQYLINYLAMAFIFFRILYGIFYIWNKSSLRSLAWFLGFFCVIILFVI